MLDALAVILPVQCAGCQTPDRALCSLCRNELVASPRVHVLAGGLRVTSALRYEGRVRSAILSFKEQGRTDVSRALAAALLPAIESAAHAAGDIVELCPIPQSGPSQHKRGYRPVELLLRRAHLRGVRVLVASGTRTRQKLLSQAERTVNLRGAFRALTALDNRRFLLVDDVVTTGSTLREAARALRARGGEVVGAATLGFTPKRNDDPGTLGCHVGSFQPT